MTSKATTKTTGSSFGELLRRHRSLKGLSQERLASDAEISTRHLSCLETGRASPSRSMVLVLGSALDVSLRDRNQMLAAAGFTPAYTDAPLEAPEAAALLQAVQHVLDAVEPNGALAFDRAGNVLRMNAGATRLMGAFMDIAAAPPEVLGNVLVAALHPQGLRPSIVNFEETAGILLERSRREAARFAGDPTMERVSKLIAAIPDLRGAYMIRAHRGALPHGAFAPRQCRGEALHDRGDDRNAVDGPRRSCASRRISRQTPRPRSSFVSSPRAELLVRSL